jgi:hypothetical protein
MLVQAAGGSGGKQVVARVHARGQNKAEKRQRM